MPQQTLLTEQAKLSLPAESLVHRVHALLGAFVLLHSSYCYTRFFQSNDDDMGFDDKDLFRASNSHEMQLNSLLYFGKCFIPHLLLQLLGFGFSLISLQSAILKGIGYGSSIGMRH